jgi:hypothetical protein
VSFGVFACNTGDKTLNLVHFGFIGYTPTVFDANGKSKSVLGPIVDLPVRPHYLSLKPGDIKRVGNVSMKIAQKSDEAANDVTPYCNLEPGTYSIQQRFVFHENQQANWHGELTTGTLEMHVRTISEIN